MAVLLAIWTFSGNQARAINILANPGFEANGGYGYFGSGSLPVIPGGWTWGTPGFGGYWMPQDADAHTGATYFKLWGQYTANPNTNSIYQDNAALPTSTYTADFWIGSFDDAIEGTSDIWQADQTRFAWGEVSFHDAGGNLLALYQSNPFNYANYGSGQTVNPSNVWTHLYITNVCQTTPPYAVIGSTSVLTAPAGTATVRIQAYLTQNANEGGNLFLDDFNLNQTGGPVAPVISQVYPGNLLFASNHISFTVNSPSSTPINTSAIHLVVNSVDVSGSCSFSGPSTNISVTYTGITSGLQGYNATITATDTYGLAANAVSMAFDTLAPAFVWEAEDYDYTNVAAASSGGLYINNPTPTSTAQPNSYTGLEGAAGIDYSVSGIWSTPFRPLDARNNQITGDFARQQYLAAQVADPATRDWEIDNIASGDWDNYTRNFPSGNYNVYARLCGNGGTPTKVSLDNVVGGAIANNVGTFSFTGLGWGTFQYVPLVDGSGNLLSIPFGGVQTLRATLASGGDNMNFFMLMPAVVGLPALSNISPTNGQVFATNKIFSFTATSSAVINSGGIQIILNGQDVSANPGTTISAGSTTANVSCALLQSNTQYTAVINVTNVSGFSTHRTVLFDTMSEPGNFYVKMEDFDFNGGLYDTAGNGLVPNAYIGDSLPGDTLGAVTNVDYSHSATSGSFPYRGPAGLATELTSDAPLPGYTVGADYDVGNFNTGDWANYTRNYPAGKYYVYGRLAGYSLKAYLDQVTSGQGTPSQTTTRLGTWSANPAGWQTWAWVPLTDSGLVSPVIVSLGGVSTLRVTSGGSVNANYFMLVPFKTINISAAVAAPYCIVSFPTIAGSTYRVFYTTSLTPPVSWTLLSTVVGDGTVKTAQTPLKGTAKFLKVVSP